MGLVPKSKKQKRLENAFSQQISEPKISVRRGIGRVKAGAVESLVSRVERGVDPATAKRLKRAEERLAERLEQQQEKQEREAKDQKARQAQRDREEAREQHARCSCRKPNLDKQGKCKRCHKVPANRGRR